MTGLRKFDEFVKKNVVKEQNADVSRAEFLVKESENSYNNLFELAEKLKISDFNANLFVKSCYDVIMELVRAKMLLDGYNASGFGAHEAEVAYLKVLGINEADVQFANQMRFFRNGIIYYGTQLDKPYAEKVMAFTKRMYLKLKDVIKTK